MMTVLSKTFESERRAGGIMRVFKAPWPIWQDVESCEKFVLYSLWIDDRERLMGR
jgi:hypothetical protein